MRLRVPIALILSLLLITVGIAGGQAAEPPQDDDTQLLQQELRTLIGQLTDPERSAKTKLEAATLLLNRSYPRAAETLCDFLADSTNRPAQIAVAEAIAAQGGSEMFIEPLMAMLIGTEPTVRSPAARALLTYKNHGVTGKLMNMALDGAGNTEIRLVVIETLSNLLDKEVVDTLVQLMADPDPGIRDASAEALARLTNIRAFGKDPAQWQMWWAKNKDKDRSQWMSDLADSLARSKLALEDQNRRLRTRLGEALVEYYKALPQVDRPAAVIRLLKDQMPEVRLAAVDLAGKTLFEAQTTDEAARAELIGLAILLLADSDSGVRQAAALLVASVEDERITPALLSRLTAEENPQVLSSVLTSLGQRREPAALDAVVEAIASDNVALSATAAWALGRIAERHPLNGEMIMRAEQVLLERYSRAESSANGVELREALLAAMGMVGDPAAAETVHLALQDTNAAVRLAAIHALGKLGPDGRVELLAPLVDDADRGVRRAAIVAVGTIGGSDQLPGILRHTRAEVEQDGDVRQQAWEAAMSILAGADINVLEAALAELSDRADATEQRIRVMQMLVTAQSLAGSAELPDLQRKLAAALVEGNRPAEAAAVLGEAYPALAEAGDPRAEEVWRDWVSALLAADDPAAAKAMDATESLAAFNQALADLHERVTHLEDDKKYVVAAMMIKAALENLPHRLTVEDREALTARQKHVADELRQADARDISRLVGELTGPDEAARKSAAEAIQAKGDRAVGPLLNELRGAVVADPPDGEREKAILAILRQVAPSLTQYEPSVDPKEKVRIIDSWQGES